MYSPIDFLFPAGEDYQIAQSPTDEQDLKAYTFLAFPLEGNAGR